jgi:citrate synthase
MPVPLEARSMVSGVARRTISSGRSSFEYKPGRKLQTNVEFYTALLLHGLELHSDLFTPTFAVSRVAGWVAHCFEQQKQNRLIRPDSEYVGEKNRRWVGG